MPATWSSAGCSIHGSPKSIKSLESLYARRTADGEIAAIQVGAALWGAGNQTAERGSALARGDQIGCRYTNLTPGNYLGPLDKIAKSPIFDRIRAVGSTVKDWQNVIHVNQTGRRFADETARGYAWVTPCMGPNGGTSNGGGPIWAIFDADAVKRESWVCASPWVDPEGWFLRRTHWRSSRARSRTSFRNNRYQGRHSRRRSPVTIRSSTPARTGISGSRLRRIDFTPPFYAAWGTPNADESLVGLHINTKSQVIDMRGQVIPGVYCGGESGRRLQPARPRTLHDPGAYRRQGSGAIGACVINETRSEYPTAH